MTTKADLKRTRMSLQQERLNLKAQALELNERQRLLTRERSLVLTVLRAACERYGDNGWTEDERLDTIIRDHLVAPLDRVTERVSRRVADLQRQLAESEAARRVLLAEARRVPAPPPIQAPSLTPPPRPLRPTPVPEPEHRMVVVRAQLRDEMGYRATCVCGSRTSFELTEAMATLEGERHVERASSSRPAAREGGAR